MQAEQYYKSTKIFSVNKLEPSVNAIEQIVQEQVL